MTARSLFALCTSINSFATGCRIVVRESHGCRDTAILLGFAAVILSSFGRFAK
ncbi:MAG TPA: hypothetical protein PLT20_07630 [Sedimentisphaerales bacterium]|nr:hypothetical protein [Sedimentisphaerales bacterium]